MKKTFLAIALILPLQARSQTMSFEDYEPPSSLVVPEHKVTRAKFPFIDVHNHQYRMASQNLDDLAAAMDKLNMAVMVNLSGRGGDVLKSALQNAASSQPDRFVIFTNLSFEDFGTEGWTERTVRRLEEDIKAGASGLKIYKSLGLTIKDTEGKRVPVDDVKLDPVWAKCGEMGVPVLIHSGEPALFWKPKDKNNERWLELKQKPGRYRDPALYPSWEQIMNEHYNVFRKHPNTTFISAHLGWRGNDLASLGKLLDEIPNMYTEIGAILAELGRQPRFAHKWFVKYQDRVLFGKDSWRPEEYSVYFRVLETADEYFDYYRRRHAFWKMYGLELPDEVLKKLYYKNALRIIPNIDKSAFPD